MIRQTISGKARQTIGLLVLLALVVSFLPACGGGDPEPTTTAPSTPPASTTAQVTTTVPPATTTPILPATTTTSEAAHNSLTAENLHVSIGGATIEVSPVCLNEAAEVTITPREDLPLLGEISITGYDFHIDTNEELAGVMTITIPYDKSQLEPGVSVEQQVGAAYFNDSTGEWESVSYDIDPINSNVVITTDHLSTFGAFVVGKEYTRAAYVQYVLPKVAIGAAQTSSKFEYNDVITEALDKHMVPGPTALELGNEIVSEWLNISGAGLTALSNTVYATDFLDGIGTAMTNVGLLSAVAQAAIDYRNDNNVALYGNLIKNLTNFAISKFGTAFMQLGSVGVFCIDYSLNKFATEAISGRMDIYQEAYRLYYASEAKRTAKDWYFLFMEMAKQAESPADLNTKVMAEIDRHSKEFWRDETKVAYYQSEAQAGGFTGGGGLNQSIMTELSNNKKYELLQGTLQPVFDQISRKMAAEQEQQVRKELETIARELNKIVTVKIFDSYFDEAVKKPDEARYSGYIARIAPLDDAVTDKKNWQAEIDDEGKAALPFRVLGHILAGSPNTIEIVSADDEDTVIKKVKFKVEPPIVDVDVTDGLPFSGIIYSSGTSNAAIGDGIRIALEAAGPIDIDKNGKFSINVPYIETKTTRSKLEWDVEIHNFNLAGTWDNDTKTGIAYIGCSAIAEATAREDIEGMSFEQWWRSDYEYTYTINGTGSMSIENGQMVIKVDYSYARKGTSTITYVYIDKGEVKEGANPTETDMSGNYTAKWSYRFDLIPD